MLFLSEYDSIAIINGSGWLHGVIGERHIIEFSLCVRNQSHLTDLTSTLPTTFRIEKVGSVNGVKGDS